MNKHLTKLDAEMSDKNKINKHYCNSGTNTANVTVAQLRKTNSGKSA